MLDDQTAARLLPKGAHDLIKTLRPHSLAGPERHQTLGKLFSVELAVDDPERRVELLSALPDIKSNEEDLLHLLRELVNRFDDGIIQHINQMTQITIAGDKDEADRFEELVDQANTTVNITPL